MTNTPIAAKLARSLKTLLVNELHCVAHSRDELMDATDTIAEYEARIAELEATKDAEFSDTAKGAEPPSPAMEPDVFLGTKLNLTRLVENVLDFESNENCWRKHCEIIQQYMPPHPRPDTRPICVVKCGESFLRYSCGPGAGHFWDCYGDDYQRPELALVALSTVGPPASSWWKKLIPQPPTAAPEEG